MKLTIDNLDGFGPRDYTACIDQLHAPRVLRRLNKPAELRLSLLANGPDFIVPVNGARLILGRTNGTDVFTGYLASAPDFEYLGWSERGPCYRYNLVVASDELLLDRKTIPERHPFVARGAGDALRQLTEDLLPGAFNTSGVQSLDPIAWYSCDRRKRWSEHAGEIALQARASYRVLSGKLTFAPAGSTVHEIDESQNNFSQDALTLQVVDERLNDLIVIGRVEPQAHVKDYFVGDGLSLRFYLSQPPFTRSNRVLLEEEYRGSSFDPTRWVVSDPAAVMTVSGGKLGVSGGTGAYGQTILRFAEKIELGGALVLQHGDVTFSSGSDGVLGGLYPGEISATGCLAGFHVRSSGSATNIQALVSGMATGPIIVAQSSHHYVLTSRFYASEVYRRRQIFHSSLHPAGSGRGGEDVPSDVRLVLEVHDIDPANPGSMVGPSTVLFDGTLAVAPGCCTYALVNAASMHCALTFTRIIRAPDAEVRSALPGQPYRTRLVGALSDGAECRVSTEPALQFFPQYVPAPNEQIVVRYRGSGQALARTTNPNDVLARGLDDGVRAAVRQVKSPAARTSADCENAGLALLEDSAELSWLGEYRTWNDFLSPGTLDIFPGDLVNIKVPSRGASFKGIVREMEIEIADFQSEHSRYKLTFSGEASQSLAFEFETAPLVRTSDVVPGELGSVDANLPPDLTAAEVTQVSSTSVTIDAGSPPPFGGEIEVRTSDSSWGLENDRNLLGRFATQSFSVPRLGRIQTYFLRQYDGSTPPRYSRYSAALHLDFPL
jgi:hypothetical protein